MDMELVLSEKSHEEQKISEVVVAIALIFVECIVVWIIYICMYLAVDQTTLAIYVHRRRNQGGTTPPDFKICVCGTRFQTRN